MIWIEAALPGNWARVGRGRLTALVAGALVCAPLCWAGPTIALLGASDPTGRTAQPIPPQAVDGLSLVVDSDRDSYLAHAPVVLSVTAENRGAKRTAAELTLQPKGGLLRFYVQGPAGETELRFLEVDCVTMPDGTICPHIALRSRRLDPGERWTVTVVVAFDPDRDTFILDKPGDYRFVARYRGPGVVLESQLLPVSVAVAQGNDAEPFRAYSKELALVTQFPAFSFVDVTPETVSHAARFLDDFPGSPYTPQLREGLKEVLRFRGASATAEERDLFAQLRSLPLPVPMRGPEREAYDAFNGDMALISSYGVGGDARALELPAATILDAGRFLARFPDSAQSAVLRSRLWMLLTARAHGGTITLEKTRLLEKVKPRR